MIQRDHEQLTDRLSSWRSASREEWDALFWQVAYELARHEFAEELTLYPALRHCGAAGAEAASVGLRQQDATERLLLRLERKNEDTDLGSPLATLATAVADHAAYEQEHLLPLLVECLSDDDRMRWGDRYTQAKKGAPTHPHPGAPQNFPGRLVLGTVAAMVDRLRDAMSVTRPRPNRSAL